MKKTTKKEPAAKNKLTETEKQIFDIGIHIEALNRLVNSADNKGSLSLDRDDVLAIQLLTGHLDQLWVKFRGFDKPWTDRRDGIKEEGAE